VHQGRTKMQLKVSGATAPFWLVLGESQNAGWKAKLRGVGSLGGSQLVDGFANGWRIDPKGRQSLVVDLEWVPQQQVWDAIAVSVLGGLVCCALVAAGFTRARRRALAPAEASDSGSDASIDEAPSFAFPWLPAGEPPAARTQVLATLAGAVVAATVAGVWAGVLVGVALTAAFRVPRARAALALAPPVLVGLIGLYVAEKQLRNALPPVFEWPILFSRATTPAWAAIVLFGADALYEMVRRGRKRRRSEVERE
jgi:arabinofuranan 3-O-arabinosyltransferase